MIKFIQLTGYYPVKHIILICPDAVGAIEQNVTNENSKGSTIHVGGAPIQVLETPIEVLSLINPSLPSTPNVIG